MTSKDERGEAWEQTKSEEETGRPAREDAAVTQSSRDSIAQRDGNRKAFAMVAVAAIIAAMVTGGAVGFAAGQSQANKAWSDRMTQQQDQYENALQYARANHPTGPVPAGPPQPAVAPQQPAVNSTVKITSRTSQESGAPDGRTAGATFQAQALDGTMVDLAEHQGDVTLLAFWTPW